MIGLLSLSLLLFAASYSYGCEQSITTVSGKSAPTGTICTGQLLLSEDFNTLNTSTWSHEVNLGNTNGEFQWYTDSPRNAFTQNGMLVIKPTLTTDVIPDLTKCNITLQNCQGKCQRTCSATNIAPPVQSARLISTNGFAFKYGRVEIRAKLPTGDWLWPALWFMPKKGVYGQWPRSGEIDLMESRGNRDMVANGVQIGPEQISSTLHFGTKPTDDAWRTAHFEKNTAHGQGLNVDFHLYQLEWTPDHINFSLDNKLIGSIATGDGYYKRGRFTGDNIWTNGTINAPFDQEFYIILNIAVGGTKGFFPEKGNASGKPWANNAPYPARDFWNGRKQWLDSWTFDPNAPFTSSMLVDYIRVHAI